MKNQNIITTILVLAIAIFFVSCGGSTNPEASMQEDAENYVKIKCENRIELSKFASDTTISKEELDSIRKIFNKDLKIIRNKYISDKELEQKFNDAVIIALETVPECEEFANRDGVGKERK